MARNSKKQVNDVEKEVTEVINEVRKEEVSEDNRGFIDSLLKEIENLKKQLNETQGKKSEVRDMHELIPCRSIVMGQLIYKSPKTMGYTVIWNNFGDVEYLELGELIAMKNVYPRFFSEPWIMIDDVDAIKYLNLEKYYKNIIDADNIDSIFDLSLEKFVDTLQKVPRGIKNVIVQRAVELIKEKKLDSIAKMEAIEKAFNVDLRIVT